MGVRWVRTEPELLGLLAAWSGPAALDAEADSLHHYRERVCLVQLAVRGLVVLLDPLAGLDLAPLAPQLGDASIPKVLHGADYDLRVLHRDFGLEIHGLFDTMVAARLVGERSFGLAALVESHLSVRLDKEHQRADWSRRPLSEEMAAYAEDDVRYLLPLAEVLEAQLREKGRLEWAHEEFRRLEAVRWTGESADPEAYRKVRGASDLDRRALAVVRELHAVRDAIARARDVPPFKVLRDEGLTLIARETPRRVEDLRSLPHVGPRLANGVEGARLLQAVERGLAIAETDLPPLAARTRRRPERAFERRVEELKRRRDAIALDLGLEPALVASRSLLEAVVRTLDDGGRPEEVPQLRAWQAKLLAPG